MPVIHVNRHVRGRSLSMSSNGEGGQEKKTRRKHCSRERAVRVERGLTIVQPSKDSLFKLLVLMCASKEP